MGLNSLRLCRDYFLALKNKDKMQDDAEQEYNLETDLRAWI